MSDEARFFHDFLKSARQRAFFAQWTRYLLFISLLLLSSALSAWASFGTATDPATALFLWIGLGVVAPGVVALLTAPGLIEVARHLDEVLGLEQRVETGLELDDPSDPVARLLLEGCWRKLQATEIRQVYPVQPMAVLKLALTLCLLQLVVGSGLAFFRESGTFQGLSLGSSWMGSSNPGTALDDNVTKQMNVAPSPGQSGTEEAEVQQVADVSQPIGQEPGHSGTESAGEVSPSVPETSMGMPEAEKTLGSVEAATRSPQEREQFASVVPASEGQGRPINSLPQEVFKPQNSAAPASGPSLPSGSRAGRGSRSNGSSTRDVADGMGRGDSQSNSGQANGAGPADSKKQESSQLEAMSSALTRQGIPPGLKRYVMDYLAAIRPKSK